VTLARNARVVREAALRAEIGLAGIEIQIEDGDEWLRRPFYGYCDPYGEVIILFPRAFESEEQLVRTLGHERIHAYQAQVFGPPQGSVDSAARELAAYASEEMWWQSYHDRL
jgi:hypothetical protein